MSNRKRYHVTKTDNGWKGAVENSNRASVIGTTKAEVQQKTINMAKRSGDSSVVIHGKKGRIQEERTYPRNSDPFPPKG